MRIAVVGLLALAVALPAVAQDQPSAPVAAQSAPPTSSAIVITLGASGDVERKRVPYLCEGHEAPLTVEYVNAQPNYLALVPLDEGTLVFANVLAASGARYASGKWVWWTKGPSADLYDLTKGADADPVMHCSERIDTP